VQHVEMAQDMAQSFNAASRRTSSSAPSTASRDGEGRGDGRTEDVEVLRNTIPIFARGKNSRRAVSSIKTTRRTTRRSARSKTDNVFAIYELLATDAEKAQMVDAYVNDRAFGYGHAKQKLTAKIEEKFGAASDRYGAFKAKPRSSRTSSARERGRRRAVARATPRRARSRRAWGPCSSERLSASA